MAVPSYVLKNRRTTLERAEKFISHVYFTDCNLFGRLYTKRSPLKSIDHYAAPGRIDYGTAICGTYTPATVGQSFGPTWSTHWFKLNFEISESWTGEEVHLLWDSGSEAMVWKDGTPLQGLTAENRRSEFVLSRKLKVDERQHSLYIEMACNKLFGAGQGSQIAPPDPNCQFTLSRAELAVFNRDAHAVFIDLQVIIGIIKSLPAECNRSYQALYTANEIVNTFVIDNVDTYLKAHDIAQKFFCQSNGDSQHTLIAIGNCHIDTAWLWPYDETKRKCARSFSSTIRLLEEYPDYTFVCSQAQQFEWVKQLYPALYEKIKTYVKKGRFIPVGGTWVEMDGYMPSGEAFIRQFMLGQKFFKKEFGIVCKEFWLPDTFGYSAQLPQIMKLAGINRFVTQKISWNLVNKFPHHTFWWSGIDGSRVLTHFPPGDSYGMHVKVEEIMKSIDNFKDKGRSNSSLFLYGYGDGGQGPTANMIERLHRMKDCDGLPKVKMSSPDEYFTQIEATDVDKLCSWSGELYLELHNGTYTTQAQVKKNNRRCEFLLRDLELISSLAFLAGRQTKNSQFRYQACEIESLWKLVLLNQFHDVLPGTSIGEVYKDVIQYYEAVVKTASSLILDAARSLVQSHTVDRSSDSPVVVNTHSWDRLEVVTVPSNLKTWITETVAVIHTNCCQTDRAGNLLALTKVPALATGTLSEQSFENVSSLPATVEAKGDKIYLRNGRLEAVIDSCGRVVCLSVAGSSRNAISSTGLGNQMILFDDVPLYWDAWDVMDYHLETRKPISQVIEPARIVESGPVRVAVEVSIKISELSSLKQTIILDAESQFLEFDTEVEWHECHKFLKVEFPADVVSPEATYEIQFGHLRRPTHFNTSWDWAKFEVCGHKWADISEFDYGLAVLNDSKYGWSCIGNVLRLSLLRSPKAPDANSDMGSHQFKYAVMPHTGSFQNAGVIQAAYDLNNRLRVFNVPLPLSDDFSSKSIVTIDQPSVILETMKQAEDIADAFVVRLYEAYGGHTTVNINLSFPIKSAYVCDVLERPITEEDTLLVDRNTFQLDFKPFQIISVVLSL